MLLNLSWLTCLCFMGIWDLIRFWRLLPKLHTFSFSFSVFLLYFPCLFTKKYLEKGTQKRLLKKLQLGNSRGVFSFVLILLWNLLNLLDLCKLMQNNWFNLPINKLFLMFTIIMFLALQILSCCSGIMVLMGESRSALYHFVFMCFLLPFVMWYSYSSNESQACSCLFFFWPKTSF